MEGQEPAVERRKLLDRTLAEMDARPTLKEELMTGVMWLRQDAPKALQAGDMGTCLEQTPSQNRGHSTFWRDEACALNLFAGKK